MFNSVSEIFGLIYWEFGWAVKLSSLQSVTFLPIFRVRVHLCDEKCCTSFPGRVLLEERRQPSRLSRHWNTLVSPLFSIFAHTHAWGISRKEGWCARRHFPSLGPWPSHHIYTRRTSPTAPTRWWWMSLQTLRNDSAPPAQRTGFGAAFWRSRFSS